MSKSLLRRPSSALVVSVVALVVALGGTAYAGSLIPNNSVGTTQLQNGAVTTKKIRNAALTTSKIANRAVTASKINASGLTVPNALHANNADNATNATNAANATNATKASHAITADRLTAPTFIPLTLINGWASYGLRTPGYVVDAQGVVHFVGAIYRATGTSINPFDMPTTLAPSPQRVYLTADENGATTGRIIVNTDGTVTVQDDPAASGSAEAFTSLEGVTYVSGTP
ncbi:MAG: hypothetical protein JO304_11200 [Solirubrobacterales bacterium]|nr:hypothetical protein [Solirubrobacterales bacterium]